MSDEKVLFVCVATVIIVVCLSVTTCTIIETKSDAELSRKGCSLSFYAKIGKRWECPDE